MPVQKTVILACALAITVTALAETNFYEQVSQMWLNGQKAGVREIGLQRLQLNTNDIAGLVLKLEYEVAYLDFTNMSSTASRVLERGGTVSSTNFIQQYQQYQVSYQIMLNVLSNYPPEDIEVDRAKTNITNKPMTFGALIKALQNDGYFQ